MGRKAKEGKKDTYRAVKRLDMWMNDYEHL